MDYSSAPWKDEWNAAVAMGAEAQSLLSLDYFSGLVPVEVVGWSLLYMPNQVQPSVAPQEVDLEEALRYALCWRYLTTTVSEAPRRVIQRK